MQYLHHHSSTCRRCIKRLAAIWLVGLFPAFGAAQTALSPEAGNAELRRTLTRLLEEGHIDQALTEAQRALREAPHDAGIRHEYINFHQSIALTWFEQRRFDDCLTALWAVLAVDPANQTALRLRRAIDTARQDAGRRLPEIDRLLRLELFDAALERVEETVALRADLRDLLSRRDHAARLGAADDHFLARDFNEAFALYEHLIAIAPNTSAVLAQRWGLSLALGLDGRRSTEPLPADAANRLAQRAAEVLRPAGQIPLLRSIRGLLAYASGRSLDAGREFAEALGQAWTLPPTDQRRARIAALRERVVERLHDHLGTTGTQRRSGPWRVVLADVWKHQQSEHFDVYARNDLIVSRLVEAAEFHFQRLAEWLGRDPALDWSPRCEIRVFESLAALHAATGTSGETRAVTQTRVKGDRVLTRGLNLYQDDGWLLNSTLPHELTHVLLADLFPSAALPVAVDEGLALQTEPPARRLQFRRRLSDRPRNIDGLLQVTDVPAETLAFYADCDALTRLLLQHAHQSAPVDAERKPVDVDHTPIAERTPVARLLATFSEGYDPSWYASLGWRDAEELNTAWRRFCAVHRRPARMPLMILNPTASQPAADPSGK